MKTYLIIIEGNDGFEYETHGDATNFQNAIELAKFVISKISGLTIEQLRIICIEEL